MKRNKGVRLSNGMVIALLFACACSRDVATGRRCAPGATSCPSEGGADAPAGAAGAAGTGGIDNPGGMGGAGVQPIDEALTVRVEDVEEMTVEIVTLACGEECAEVEAVASGGRRPYTFTWSDGMTGAARELCAESDGAFTVTVDDTPLMDEEFSYEGQTTSARVAVDVLQCPGDAGDAGAPPDCEGGEALGEITPDIYGTPTYFAEGAALEAGRYRIAYVDGCLRYEGPWAWAVNGVETYEYLVIGDTTADVLGVAPGAMGSSYFGAAFDYPEFEDCLAASHAQPPLDLDFAGGRLGIWNNDFKPEDNVPGPDGRSPTWRLSRCD